MNTTPNFQIWYLMSMEVILKRCNIGQYPFSMNNITGDLCQLNVYYTMQTQSCLVPPVSSHVADSRPVRLNQHPGAQQFFLCHRCLHTYPEPGHRHNTPHEPALYRKNTKFKYNSPFVWQTYPSSCLGRSCRKKGAVQLENKACWCLKLLFFVCVPTSSWH